MSLQNDPAHQPSENDAVQMRNSLKRVAIIAGCILGGIILIGAYVRFSQASSVTSWTQDTDVPIVTLISPTASGKNQSLTFPGTLEAYYDANIYSRVPGYVLAWYKDIGAQVKKGDVLAAIDTPELDQQISQARADLSNTQAAQKLSAMTAQRWQNLLPLDAVSKQDAEEKEEDLQSKTGAVKAAQANLDRLAALKAFGKIVSPFDGVVTKRNIDIGGLVNAGSPSSPSEPLFAVFDVHKLRLYVNVPQDYSAEIVPGMSVSLSVPEYPGRHFAAKLVSTSNAISAQSTLLVEFEADNAQGLLKPGDYAQVDIGLPGTASKLRLPASALMFRAAGLQVATLGNDNRIVMKPITIGTDMGTQVIVASGLSPRDRVVNNPPDSLGNGDKVRVSRMRSKVLLAFGLAALLAGCDLAPDYKVPATPVVTDFKEQGIWTKATPQDALPRGAWWEIYGDTTLSGLEGQIESGNPTLAEALARYDAAQGFLIEAQSGLFPALGLGGHADADKQSANRPLRSASQPTYYGDNAAAAAISWDLDLWGRIRNEVAAGKAQTQSVFADLAAVRLSLQIRLANDYLELRGLDAEAKLLSDTVAVYDKAYKLTNYRHEQGIASGLDLGRAQTQLSAAQAQLADVLAHRALFEHAIASLVGTPASNFSIAPIIVTLRVPNVPAGMPSTLLQRRPDVAAAERLVVASNAGIGVARAAFFPDLSLSALIGLQNTGSNPLFTAPNAFWALGPNVALTVFDAGRHEGELAVAKAENATATAAYRATVLKAFQDVEDNLVLLNQLATEADAQSTAVTSAVRTENLALALYQNGALNFLDVVVAQTTALQAQQIQIGIVTRRLEASVGMIGALGGGWSVRQLPDFAQNSVNKPG